LNSAEFYRDRMTDALAQADAAGLDNVRDRCLRSAAVWEGLADRAMRIDTERAERDEATRLKRTRPASELKDLQPA
jgi:hypothetical protein